MNVLRPPRESSDTSAVASRSIWLASSSVKFNGTGAPISRGVVLPLPGEKGATRGVTDIGRQGSCAAKCPDYSPIWSYGGLCAWWVFVLSCFFPCLHLISCAAPVTALCFVDDKYLLAARSSYLDLFDAKANKLLVTAQV